MSVKKQKKKDSSLLANILAYITTAVIVFYALRWVFKIAFTPVVLAVFVGVVIILGICKWLTNRKSKPRKHSEPLFQHIDTQDDGAISTSRSYRQSGAHTGFLDISPIIGLPYKFSVEGKQMDLENIDDIRAWPVMTSKFSINGTDYYINNYFRLCAKLYEQQGRVDIADALRQKASEMECDPLFGDYLRQKSQHFLRVKDIKKLSENQQTYWAQFDQQHQKRTESISSELNEDFLEQIRQDEESWRRQQRHLSPVDEEMLRIDCMDGSSFERWCANLLKKNGFMDVSITGKAGDQGVDVLAEKDGITYAIQCKCYSHDLGNTPIQEVSTGKQIYHRHVGAVMTNRYFTQGGIDAAKATGTLLWDRDKLIEMLENQ